MHSNANPGGLMAEEEEEKTPLISSVRKGAGEDVLIEGAPTRRAGQI